MKHDEAHEVKQNKVLRHLAHAIAQVAAHNGHSGCKGLVAEVDAMLDADEAEAPDAAPAIEVTDAEADQA